MNKIEFERLLDKVPGVKERRILASATKVRVEFTFKWYMKPVKKALLAFLSEVFTYLHVPGTVIYFTEKRR